MSGPLCQSLIFNGLIYVARVKGLKKKVSLM